ncbi:unnamed protein product [Nippostrongylus brasiliensis]|uniref:Transmembrane protein 188 n=1 Tax=Nippostrongylus brasiliensis TaxID=27835 RepID=A0A0N4XCN2_NIPBR|nr:unnamed protein product [Nippostrongylus brasiliensis]
MMGPEGKSSPREHYTAMDKNRMRKDFFEQQKIPENQKFAFQQLIREILEQRKAVHKLWKYVFLFLAIGIAAVFGTYFLTCWAEYLEVVETKYVIREEIFASVQHHSLIPWNLTNSICSYNFFGGIRLAWKIWHVWRTKVDTQELENDPIKVLSETLQRDFLSHIADSGLAF